MRPTERSGDDARRFRAPEAKGWRDWIRDSILRPIVALPSRLSPVTLAVAGTAFFAAPLYIATDTVREFSDASTITGMTLEHYPGMTERALEDIVAQARSRFDIGDALVIHRVGSLAPGDQIVLVAVTSAHRGQAFDACEFIMDWLKTRAPFWKKERLPDGERWVEARASDDEAAQRW